MGSIQQATEQQGFRQRADRRPTQGQVIDVDPITHTCTVDIKRVDTQGNPVYWENLAFQPQSPPSPGDTVTIGYTNSSPHSAIVIGSQLSGQNSQSSLTVVGGVSSVRLASETAKTKGDVVLTPGTGMTIVRSGGSFTFNSSGSGSSPLTTKGDLWIYDSGNNRLPVGANGQVLTADSTQASGLKWATPSTGSGLSSPLTTKGDVWVFGTADARLGIGTDGQVLTADSTQALGVKWSTPSSGGGSSGAIVEYSVFQSGGSSGPFTFPQIIVGGSIVPYVIHLKNKLGGTVTLNTYGTGDFFENGTHTDSLVSGASATYLATQNFSGGLWAKM